LIFLTKLYENDQFQGVFLIFILLNIQDVIMRLELFDADSLNFIELNTTGDEETYVACDQESKYLETEVFNIFIDCFERSSKVYDYFEPTKYNARNIVALLNEFKKKVRDLENLSSPKSFESYINKMFLGRDFMSVLQEKDAFWEENWNKYKNQLIKIAQDIIALIDECIEKDCVLWIIGY